MLSLMLIILSFQKFQKLFQVQHLFTFFSPYFDTKLSKYTHNGNFSHESYQDFLQRYDKPMLLIIYLISYHNCWKLSQECLQVHLSAVFGFKFNPKFCKLALEIFFTWIMSTLYIWKTFPLYSFLCSFQKNVYFYSSEIFN